MKWTMGARVALGMTVFGLSACAQWVKLDSGAEVVNVVNAEAVSHCEARGTTAVSVLNKVGWMDRDPVDIERELATLARNSAHASGGDTVVEIGSQKEGKGNFAVYRCQK